jgi:hypothetical protein
VSPTFRHETLPKESKHKLRKIKICSNHQLSFFCQQHGPCDTIGSSQRPHKQPFARNDHPSGLGKPAQNSSGRSSGPELRSGPLQRPGPRLWRHQKRPGGRASLAKCRGCARRAPFPCSQAGSHRVLVRLRAFSLRPEGAFARGGFASTCMGRTCSGKGVVYARGSNPFIWERKRNRGGAIICRGAGGHLLCLRCMEAQYEEGDPFVSNQTGCPVSQEQLFTKYEVFLSRNELREVRSGEEASDGGFQFFVQRRDLATCPYCRESKAAASLKRGIKRQLKVGPSPQELGTVAVLSELKRSKIPPLAVAPGLFLVPLLDISSGCLLDVSVTDQGLVHVPRLVKIDHMGKFSCLCDQRACRDHDLSFLDETRFMGGWWHGGMPSSQPLTTAGPLCARSSMTCLGCCL